MGNKIMEFDSSLESTKTLYTISPNWGETLFFFLGAHLFLFSSWSWLGWQWDGTEPKDGVFILCLIPSLSYPV